MEATKSTSSGAAARASGERRAGAAARAAAGLRAAAALPALHALPFVVTFAAHSFSSQCKFVPIKKTFKNYKQSNKFHDATH